MKRVPAALIVVVAGTVAAATGSSMTATPAVSVAELAPMLSGSGSPITIKNTGSATLSGGKFTPMTCGNGAGISPVFPPSLGSNAMFVAAAVCPGTLVQGMRRCPIAIQDSGGTTLDSVMSVCTTFTTSNMTASATTLDFGTVIVNSTGMRTVTLGTAPVATTLYLQTTDIDVFRIDAPSPCNGTSGCDVAVTATGSVDLALSCHPRAAIAYTANLYAVTARGDRLAQPITLTCSGTPATSPAISVTPSPNPFDLGGVEVLTGSASGTIALENVGTGTLVISAIDLAGATTDWSYKISGNCVTVPCNLATGDEARLAVTFDPTQMFARDATLTIHSNDPLHATTSIALAGTGLGRTFELANPTSSIDFGYVENGQSAQLVLQLVNRGNKPLTDGNVMLSMMGPFSVSPSNPITVPTTAPVNLTVTCAPTGTGTNAFMTTLTGSAADSLKPDFTVMTMCHGTDSPLTAMPATIVLGELTTGTGTQAQMIELRNHSASALTLSGDPTLKTPNASLTIMPPATLTIAANDSITFELDADTSADADLADAIVVSDGTHTIEIPISGKVTTPKLSVPASVALGTFCVGDPTTASLISLTATGTGTVHLTMAPAMQASPSGFLLSLRAPAIYPAALDPMESATVDVEPKTTTVKGEVHDDVVWHTDVAMANAPHTTVSATFLDDGAAIAPAALAFGRMPIIVVTPDAQPVTLQNCGTTQIAVSATIHHPFAIDSPDFPTMLMPQETTTFTVGFHPTKVGVYTDILTIKPTGLPELQVALSGEGYTGSDTPDAGTDVVHEPSSFYSCGCKSSDPRGGWPLLFALLCLRRRRR